MATLSTSVEMKHTPTTPPSVTEEHKAFSSKTTGASSRTPCLDAKDFILHASTHERKNTQVITVYSMLNEDSCHFRRCVLTFLERKECTDSFPPNKVGVHLLFSDEGGSVNNFTQPEFCPSDWKRDFPDLKTFNIAFLAFSPQDKSIDGKTVDFETIFFTKTFNGSSDTEDSVNGFDKYEKFNISYDPSVSEADVLKMLPHMTVAERKITASSSS